MSSSCPSTPARKNTFVTPSRYSFASSCNACRMHSVTFLPSTNPCGIAFGASIEYLSGGLISCYLKRYAWRVIIQQCIVVPKFFSHPTPQITKERKYLCLKSPYIIRFGNPLRQIRIPSKTPLQCNYRKAKFSKAELFEI